MVFFSDRFFKGLGFSNNLSDRMRRVMCRSKKVFHRHVANAMILAGFFVFCATPAFAVKDVSSVDINGFRLGMTLKQVKDKYPDFTAREVKPDNKLTIGYSGRVGKVTLDFTSKDLGQRLFNIRLTEVYASKRDPYPIFEKFKAKYGTPDYGGRQMFHIQACWGKCFGKHQKLEFRIKIGGMAGKPFPMSLTLSDGELESKNRRLFFRKKAAAK